MPTCLTLSIIRYGSRVKWSNPGKGVAHSLTSSGRPRPWSPTLLTYYMLYVQYFRFEKVMSNTNNRKCCIIHRFSLKKKKIWWDSFEQWYLHLGTKFRCIEFSEGGGLRYKWPGVYDFKELNTISKVASGWIQNLLYDKTKQT